MNSRGSMQCVVQKPGDKLTWWQGCLKFGPAKKRVVWFRFYWQYVFPLSKFAVRWWGVCCCSGKAAFQKMVQCLQMVKCESTVMIVQFGPPHQGWVWMLHRWRNRFWKTDELQFGVANITIVREWKWLFMSDCKYWSLISRMTEFYILLKMRNCVNVFRDYVEI